MNPYLFMATIFVCLFAVTGMYSSSAESTTAPYVSFVDITEGSSNSQFYIMIVETAIQSPVQQEAVVAIYVQDPDMTPVGVMLFKTTLLAGSTPIEFGFTIPNECAYNTMVHHPICSKDIPRTVYVNVFSDYIENGGVPITPEFVGENA